MGWSDKVEGYKHRYTCLENITNNPMKQSHVPSKVGLNHDNPLPNMGKHLDKCLSYFYLYVNI